MTFGQKSSSSPSLRQVRMPASSQAPLTLFRSGIHCQPIHFSQFEYVEPAVDRVGYGVGFGHFFPDFIRV